MGIPQFLNGNADENEEEGNAYHPKNDESPNDVGPFLEMGETEDAIVHHQKTKFSPNQVEGVENLSDEKEFGHQDDSFEWNGICVKTHATSNHPEYESNDDKVPCLLFFERMYQ